MLRQERHQRQQSLAEEDDLEELENVTSDIKEWLTSTFATKQQVRVPAYSTVHYIDYISPNIGMQPTRKSVETPSLRSVANAIRTGKFLEKIYSSMSSKHVLIFPDDVLTKLEVCKSHIYILIIEMVDFVES